LGETVPYLPCPCFFIKKTLKVLAKNKYTRRLFIFVRLRMKTAKLHKKTVVTDIARRNICELLLEKGALG